MNPPPIQWLPVFEASARFKSFRKAAGFLHVSPPAVSQQIKALEDYLGVALFSRQGRQIELTPAGAFYYQVARQLVSSHVQGFREFDRRFNHRSLRLSTPLFIAQEILIPNYLGYKALEPAAELRITTGAEYVDFESGTADAAIRFGLGDWPTLTARLLSNVQICPVCAPDYLPSNAAASLSLMDVLQSHTLLSTKEGLSDWLHAFPGLQPQDSIICDSYFSAIKSAEKGLGIALGIFPAINGWINDCRLCCVGDEMADTGAGYWLVYPPLTEPNSLFDSCYQWAKGLFEALPPRVR